MNLTLDLESLLAVALVAALTPVLVAALRGPRASRRSCSPVALRAAAGPTPDSK